MNASSTLLNEELGELHDRSQTSMSSIRIGDDWAKKISVRDIRTVGLGGRESFFALLAIVEKLCHEKVANLVGYGSLIDLAQIVQCSQSSLRRGSLQDLDRAHL